MRSRWISIWQALSCLQSRTMPARVCQPHRPASVDPQRDTCPRPCRDVMRGYSVQGEAGNAFSSPREGDRSSTTAMRLSRPRIKLPSVWWGTWASIASVLGVEARRKREGNNGGWRMCILGALSICGFPKHRGALQTDGHRHRRAYVSGMSFQPKRRRLPAAVMSVERRGRGGAQM